MRRRPCLCEAQLRQLVGHLPSFATKDETTCFFFGSCMVQVQEEEQCTFKQRDDS